MSLISIGGGIFRLFWCEENHASPFSMSWLTRSFLTSYKSTMTIEDMGELVTRFTIMMLINVFETLDDRSHKLHQYLMR